MRGRGHCLVGSLDGQDGRGVLCRSDCLVLSWPVGLGDLLGQHCASGGPVRWSLQRLWKGACGFRLSALLKTDTFCPKRKKKPALSTDGSNEGVVELPGDGACLSSLLFRSDLSLKHFVFVIQFLVQGIW